MESNSNTTDEQFLGYVSAARAKQLLSIKDTNLFYLRKRNQLVFSKIGRKVFYQLESIKKLLERNRQGGEAI